MESKQKYRHDNKLRLMDQVKQVLRYHHYAYRTEQTYCDWIVRFIKFHGSNKHPKDMGKTEIEAFLSHLATDRRVSRSTQKQALNAIVFLYRDFSRGYGEVHLPEGPGRKYPGASKEFRWQYFFPSKSLSDDPRTGITRRNHVLESGLQKAVKTAVDRAGITKRVSCHTFRHCFAIHLLENGVNIRVVQQLMGHADVKTTEIYTHVMSKDIDAVLSPLDHLLRPGTRHKNHYGFSG
ncbi:MAG: phage integrase N-terminal SAM-like domain-containing protein [Deltaproteobacteria bacterium]|nr:phage integrase N-terminal SAM-like domain-containing protein [Deltaproteobacteria bacterium]